MKYLIQLRGSNASGKSTAVRQFCQKFELKPAEVRVGGKCTSIMTNGIYTVVGKYKPYSSGEGCDAHVDDAAHLRATIFELLRSRKYDIVVFEGLIYSFTYKFATDVDRIAKLCGYKYKPALLRLPYDERLRRLFERNGGNTDISLRTLDQKLKSGEVSAKKIREAGIPLTYIDVSKIPVEDMWKIVFRIGMQDEQAH